MNWVAWQMLTGDRAKYFGTIFGIAFGTLLISQQTALFVGLMRRTASQIEGVREATIWVMDPEVQNTDEIRPLSETDVYRVRGVEGVSWAVRYYKGLARAKVADGRFRQVMLMGLDETTMIGAPVELVLGSLADLARPDGIIVDRSGFEYLWPGVEPQLGQEIEMNDRRAVVVGICQAGAPFQTFPLVFTRYARAREYAPPERNRLSFVLARPAAGYDTAAVCQSIGSRTGLLALSRDEFFWRTIGYYLKSTGIPVNFGITIALGFIVGTAIAGQTFYLFTLENLRQFGALKAMGLTNGRLVLIATLIEPPVVAPSAAGLAVRCDAVVKEFGEGDTRLRVLHEVDLEVPTGELSLLVGPSGCGKTTLISIIAGLLEPTAGDVTLFGTPRSSLTERQLIEYRAANIGFVFQQYNLLPALTATANVAIPLLISRVDRTTAFARARELLNQVGLADKFDAFPSQLSGGQQQRVAIARALVHEPRLLVCDEPTAALDAHSGQTVLELLCRVAVHPQRAVIVVTHDNRIFGYGNRILEMTDGRIQAVRTNGAGSCHAPDPQSVLE